MNTKPPIKCTPCRVTYNNERYRIYSDGSVSEALSAEEAGKLGIKNAKEALEYEFNSLPVMTRTALRLEQSASTPPNCAATAMLGNGVSGTQGPWIEPDSFGTVGIGQDRED